MAFILHQFSHFSKNPVFFCENGGTHFFSYPCGFGDFGLPKMAFYRQKSADKTTCSDLLCSPPSNPMQNSKCGRSAQNRRESSNLSISAMRSASEKLVDLFPFYGETADRFCSMGATMSCSMAAADCFFVAYCRCP